MRFRLGEAVVYSGHQAVIKKVGKYKYTIWFVGKYGFHEEREVKEIELRRP